MTQVQPDRQGYDRWEQDAFIEWINEGLRLRPELTQMGLAAHLGLHRSRITDLVRGKRILLAGEIEKIESYLGLKAPVSSGKPLISGRIGATWHDEREEVTTDVGRRLPNLLGIARTDVVYLLDQEMLGFPAGSAVIATPIRDGWVPESGRLAVVRRSRERSMLRNYRLIRVGEGESGEVVAIANEIRIAV